MKYTEQLPPEEFQHIIKDLWQFDVTPHTHQYPSVPIQHEILPEETVSIVFIHQPFFSDIRLMGPQLKKFQLPVFPTSVFMGVRFQPWITAESIFGEKVKLRNKTEEVPNSLREIFSKVDPGTFVPGTENFHLLEEGLFTLKNRKLTSEDPLTKYVCIRLMDGEKIESIVHDLPLSIRPVQKRFKQKTGLTMAEYRNILRLQKTVREIFYNKKDKVEYIFQQGYYDQSHFIHDFKKYMDKPLEEFLSYVQLIEH